MQGKSGAKLYSDFENDRNQGDFSALPELHSVLSGMKVRANAFYQGIFYHKSFRKDMSPMCARSVA